MHSAPSAAVSSTRDVSPGFSDVLKAWRLRRRMSQLDLAVESGVSQRHVSFLESGRSRPSRTMILQLSETLDVPLRERNAWLLAGGFAPMFAARPFDDPEMQAVMAAVRAMLANHEPFPAVAIDRAWNIRLANMSFDRLSGLLGDDLWQRVGGEARNLLRLCFHPLGLRPLVANWDEVAPLLWHRARREAEALGGDDTRAILAELAPHQDAATLWSGEHVPLVPVLPLSLTKDGVRLTLFTVISTFGTAQDITADELRIESFFPADEATAQVFHAMAGRTS